MNRVTALENIRLRRLAAKVRLTEQRARNKRAAIETTPAPVRADGRPSAVGSVNG